MDPLDVGVGISSDLELESTVAFLAVSGDLGSHLVGGLLRDGTVEHEVVPIPSTEQGTHGLSTDLAKDVPAGDIDGRLGIGVPLERRIHPAIELVQMGRILTQQVRRELGDTRPGPGRVGRQIERPERADLTVTRDPGVGFDPNDGAVEDRDRLAPRPLVTAFMQRQIDLKHGNPRDLHDARDLILWPGAEVQGRDKLGPNVTEQPSAVRW